MARRVSLRGFALHAGVETTVTLEHRAGPLAFSQAGDEVPLDALSVVRADQGVTLAGAGLRVDLVEHLLAATAGLGIRDNLRIVVEGPELPLLDGGAAMFFDALASLEIPASPPALSIKEAAVLRAGDSVYRFEPGTGVALDAAIAFDHPAIGEQEASWEGDARDFRERIAPARTFGFLRDAERLRAAGRAHHVDPRAVIVLTDDSILDASLPLRPNEAAHHKLLDLIGDLAVYGGPPRGAISAVRPGHSATHAVVREALARGILGRGDR